MPVSNATIDRIVANVLNQLSPPDAPVAPAPQPESPANLTLTERVITAETLDSIPAGATVAVGAQSILTPSANDLIRERGLEIIRTQNTAATDSATSSVSETTSPAMAAYIVRHTDPLHRALQDQLGNAAQELLGCPDEAAQLAISAICRGEVTTVLIFAEQTHRAACFANRNEAVKAVVVRDIGDVKSVRKQLRVNVWCIDPTNRSYFELRNLFREIHPRK